MAWKFWQKAPQDAKPLPAFTTEPVEVRDMVPGEPLGVLPAREQGEAPAPTTYCVITKWKVGKAVVIEHHSVCDRGPAVVAPGPGVVTVTTGHWV